MDGTSNSQKRSSPQNASKQTAQGGLNNVASVGGASAAAAIAASANASSSPSSVARGTPSPAAGQRASPPANGSVVGSAYLAAPAQSPAAAVSAPAPSSSPSSSAAAAASAAALAAASSSPYRALPVGSSVGGVMNPAMTSRIASSQGQVYRSLSVASANPQADHLSMAMAGMVVKEKAHATSTAAPRLQGAKASFDSSSAQPNNNAGVPAGVPRLALPLDVYPLAKTHTWFQLDDPEEVVARVESALNKSVATYGGEIKLQRAANKCRFECRANGETTSESVNFAVNVFDAAGESKAPARFLAEAERQAGCPFLFNIIMGQIVGESPLAPVVASPTPAKSAACRRAFVAPALPESLIIECPCGKGMECACADHQIMSLLGSALSPVQEQRVQAVCSLADSCARDKHFASRFAILAREAGDRLGALRNDADPMVRRASERLQAALVGV